LDDGSRVGSTGNDYVLHQFKDYTTETKITLHWNGQSNLAPSSSTVYLQIYNRNTTTWDTVDSDGVTAAATDFDLEANIADLTNYLDEELIICCRVYQQQT